jgi:hypothetical protein
MPRQLWQLVTQKLSKHSHVSLKAQKTAVKVSFPVDEGKADNIMERMTMKKFFKSLAQLARRGGDKLSYRVIALALTVGDPR